MIVCRVDLLGEEEDCGYIFVASHRDQASGPWRERIRQTRRTWGMSVCCLDSLTVDCRGCGCGGKVQEIYSGCSDVALNIDPLHGSDDRSHHESAVGVNVTGGYKGWVTSLTAKAFPGRLTCLGLSAVSSLVRGVCPSYASSSPSSPSWLSSA